MDIKTEKKRIEQAEKVLQCIESAYKRIRIKVELTSFFDGLFLTPDTTRCALSVKATEQAIKKLERYYYSLLNVTHKPSKDSIPGMLVNGEFINL